jgi:hypothetical protein
LTFNAKVTSRAREARTKVLATTGSPSIFGRPGERMHVRAKSDRTECGDR